jgi:hypothetical protein
VLGVSVEALTLVVAAHELAHAYTHLGRDIDGERWTTENFAATNLAIAEGLAQFYAKVICKKLETRFPAAWEAYERLLKLQSGPYLVHEEWTEGGEAAGEVVRISMITCRSTNTTKLGRFEVMRRQQAERLGKVEQHAIPKTGEPPGHPGKALDDKKRTLQRPVMDALLWLGRYYYAGGVTNKEEWRQIIQGEMGPDVKPHLDDAWNRMARQPTERNPNRVFHRGRDVASSGTPVQKSANKTNLNSRALLDSVVAKLRAIPERLSGDDSPLADPWEEIKSQVQEELSPFWPAYLDTIKQFVNAAVQALSSANLLALSSELKLSAGESSRIREALLRRLIARARKEKIRYAPFGFQCSGPVPGEPALQVEPIIGPPLYERSPVAWRRAKQFFRGQPESISRIPEDRGVEKLRYTLGWSVRDMPAQTSSTGTSGQQWFPGGCPSRRAISLRWNIRVPRRIHKTYALSIETSTFPIAARFKSWTYIGRRTPKPEV